MNEHIILAAVGANVGLAGVSGAVHSFLEAVNPILSHVLLLLQVAVAAITAWFLIVKVKEANRKEKFYEAAAAKRARVRTRKRKACKAAKAAAVIALAFATIFLFSGCSVLSPQVPGGHISTKLADQYQSKSPKDATTLVTEFEREESYVLPAGTAILSDGKKFVLQTNMPVRIVTREKVDSNIGAADLSIGKMIAKLQSMRWIQVVGIGLMLFGIASMVYPPLRVLVSSFSTSVIVAAAGLGLIVLPILLVGHEILILSGCLGVALAYFFLHRYGKKSGEIEMLTRWVDKNENGQVDPGEMVKVKK